MFLHVRGILPKSHSDPKIIRYCVDAGYSASDRLATVREGHALEAHAIKLKETAFRGEPKQPVSGLNNSAYIRRGPFLNCPFMVSQFDSASVGSSATAVEVPNTAHQMKSAAASVFMNGRRRYRLASGLLLRNDSLWLTS